MEPLDKFLIPSFPEPNSIPLVELRQEDVLIERTRARTCPFILQYKHFMFILPRFVVIFKSLLDIPWIWRVLIVTGVHDNTDAFFKKLKIMIIRNFKF